MPIVGESTKHRIRILHNFARKGKHFINLDERIFWHIFLNYTEVCYYINNVKFRFLFVLFIFIP